MSDETKAQMGPEQDPTDFTVDDVSAYLDGVTDPGETARVLSAEAAGQNRKGLVEKYANPANAEQAPENADHREDAEAMGYDLVDVSDKANNPDVVEIR